MKPKGWNNVDEKCPHCNSVTKRATGISKQNIKRLFAKPTLQDIMIFIMLVACLSIVWTYKHDIAQYKYIFENPAEFCMIYTNQLSMQNVPFELNNFNDTMIIGNISRNNFGWTNHS